MTKKWLSELSLAVSGAPRGSYCTFSDTLRNSINRSVLPRRRERKREPRIDGVDAPFFRSNGYVKARTENCRRIRLEWRLPSARKVESYPEIRGLISVPRETATFAASLTRGMHYFAAWKCPRTGNRCRIA